jgi:hypothetical protein
MPLPLSQLERHLFKAANILLGKMDVIEFKEWRQDKSWSDPPLILLRQIA